MLLKFLKLIKRQIYLYGNDLKVKFALGQTKISSGIRKLKFGVQRIRIWKPGPDSGSTREAGPPHSGLQAESLPDQLEGSRAPGLTLGAHRKLVGVVFCLVFPDDANCFDFGRGSVSQPSQVFR